jgi:hypothetical protein
VSTWPITILAHPPATMRAGVADAISTARFSTYLKHASNVESHAWAAYAWNVRASAAMLQVLTHMEVALRNGVNRALVAAFGAAWPYNSGFEITFPVYERARYMTARRELEKRLKKKPLATGDFVAGQTLAFWESMLVTRYKARMWDVTFAAAFPGAGPAVTYRSVRDAVERLRLLRNRIAHHEPLLTVDLNAEYTRAMSVIRWASVEKAAWVRAEWPPAPELAGPP